MRTLAPALVTAALLALPVAALADTTGAQGPPDHVLALAHGAAAEARGVALGLAEDVAAGSQGRGSAAFAERHALLAEKHAEHPGNAAAVHAALAEGRSPSTVEKEQGNGGTPPGLAKKTDAGFLRGAAAQLREGRPGLGIGRDRGGDD